MTVLRSVLSGRDTLGLISTGAGQSLCYRLAAALARNGAELVLTTPERLANDAEFVEALKRTGIRTLKRAFLSQPSL